jgi:hypothetical protein
VNIYRKPRLRDHNHGQAALEFMLVIPAFVIFLGLVVDFGMLTYQYVSIANAAREGARYAATNCFDFDGECSETRVRNQTIMRSGGILSPANAAEVTVGWINRIDPTSNSGRGDSVVVRINHPYNFMFVPVGPSIPVVACADMRLEQRDRGLGLPTGTECSAR